MLSLASWEKKQDLENWEKAIDDHTEAIRLQPSYGIAYKHRGKAYRRSGNMESSLADLTKAIAVWNFSTLLAFLDHNGHFSFLAR